MLTAWYQAWTHTAHLRGDYVEVDSQRTVQRHHYLFNSDNILSTPDEYSLHLDSRAKHFAPPAYSVPPSLADKIRGELQCLKDNGTIQEVEGPMDWSSPTVIVYQNSDMRWCTYFSAFNKYVKCKQFQLPAFKELTCRVNGSQIFSVLDYQSSYWQIPVTVRSSQLLLTSSMSFGTY